jgi:DNA-binding NarL/FixJ family response regulator
VERPLRVVIADDAVLLREAVADLLRRHGIEIVAEVGDPESLLRAIAATGPDVAIVDIRMPPTQRAEGLHAAVEIRRRHPETAVLLLSQYLESHYLSVLLGREASKIGYLLKERVSGGAALVATIHQIAAGGCVIDPTVISALLDGARPDDPITTLTDRERAVLALMAEGRSDQAVGERLELSGPAVETLVRSIFGRLGLAPAPDDHRRVLAVLTYLRFTRDQPPRADRPGRGRPRRPSRPN